MPSQVENLQKKDYHRPQIVVYGDLNEITRAINSNIGNWDGNTINFMQLKTAGTGT